MNLLGNAQAFTGDGFRLAPAPFFVGDVFHRDHHVAVVHVRVSLVTIDDYRILPSSFHIGLIGFGPCLLLVPQKFHLLPPK